MDLGFIGLGNIGGPCARHLVEAGHRVTVFDIDEGAVDRTVQLGARAAGPTADVAAGTEAVFLSLPTPEASEAVVAGEGGLLAAGRPGLVVVDLSTNSVGAHRVLARSLEGGLGDKFFIGAMETLEAEAGFVAPIPPDMNTS